MSWGYSVVDSKYEQEEVIPWQAKRELFNRLRIQRNNIAHSESNKVQELTLQELADCLEFVFSLKKEIVSQSEHMFLFYYQIRRLL